MLRVLMLSLILTGCGAIPSDEGVRETIRGANEDRSPAARTSQRTPNRVATGAIGGAVAGEVIGGEPIAGGLIGGDIGAVD